MPASYLTLEAPATVHTSRGLTIITLYPDPERAASFVRLVGPTYTGQPVILTTVPALRLPIHPLPPDQAGPSTPPPKGSRHP